MAYLYTKPHTSDCNNEIICRLRAWLLWHHQFGTLLYSRANFWFTSVRWDPTLTSISFGSLKNPDRLYLTNHILDIISYVWDHTVHDNPEFEPKNLYVKAQFLLAANTLVGLIISEYPFQPKKDRWEKSDFDSLPGPKKEHKGFCMQCAGGSFLLKCDPCLCFA